jgi:hypothetical protein
VSQISIKTGNEPTGETAGKAVLKICDMHNYCCQTTDNGNGLDDISKKDRQLGQTDSYSDQAILNTCSKVCLIQKAKKH